MPQTPPDAASLQDQLTALREGAKDRIPAPALEVMHRATRELVASGRAEEALGVGERLPRFELPDSEGETVSSQALLDRGPLVVTFYRGVW